MSVNQSLINSMIKNIKDPKLRETYGNIASGNYMYKVYCLNPQINPLTKKPFHAKKCAIGFITKSGQVIDAVTIAKKTGQPIAGIESSRDRFDGRKGIKCYCGNWSIQCDEEKGVLEQSPVPTPPTKEQLEQISYNLQKTNKGPLGFIRGWAEYDGFGLEEVQS